LIAPNPFPNEAEQRFLQIKVPIELPSASNSQFCTLPALINYAISYLVEP
jgi:hypothetical protein